jgi:soluble lytic murein transglycosylase-like protein
LLKARKIIVVLIIIAMVGITVLASVASVSASTISSSGQTTAAEKKAKKAEYKAKYISSIAKYIHTRGISWKKSRRLAKHFYNYGKKNNIGIAALMSIAQHESNFREEAYNPAGYYGIMQCSAQIGRSWAGVSASKLLNAKYCIKAGSGLFKYNVKTLGSYYMGFAGYQAGTYGAKAGNYSRSAVNSRMRVMRQIRKYLNKHRGV